MMGDWWVGLMGFAAGLLLASIINERDHRDPHDQSKAPRGPYAADPPDTHAFVGEPEGRCDICGRSMLAHSARIVPVSRPQGTE